MSDIERDISEISNWAAPHGGGFEDRMAAGAWQRLRSRRRRRAATVGAAAVGAAAVMFALGGDLAQTDAQPRAGQRQSVVAGPEQTAAMSNGPTTHDSAGDHAPVPAADPVPEIPDAVPAGAPPDAPVAPPPPVVAMHPDAPIVIMIDENGEPVVVSGFGIGVQDFGDFDFEDFEDFDFEVFDFDDLADGDMTLLDPFSGVDNEDREKLREKMQAKREKMMKKMRGKAMKAREKMMKKMRKRSNEHRGHYRDVLREAEILRQQADALREQAETMRRHAERLRDSAHSDDDIVFDDPDVDIQVMPDHDGVDIYVVPKAPKAPPKPSKPARRI